MEKFLASASDEAACRVTGGTLSYWAVCLEHEGVILAANSHAEGWTLLSKAAACRYWDDRIRCRSYDRAPNKRKAKNFIPNTLQVGLNTLYCFSLDQWEEGLWLGKRLEQSRSDGSVDAWSWEKPTTYLALALTRCIETQEIPQISDLKLAVYEGIFRAWSDPPRLKAALAACADYHVERIRGGRREDFCEFSGSPWDVFPAELHAIYKVRERMGRQTPVLDHPLMATPFGHPPKTFPPVQDDLLERVIAKVHEIMPDL